ncbi:MAG: translocation/assembly module TamB domain-containing protein [bacterium]
MKKIARFFSILVLGLIIFVLVFTMFTQTPIFKRWLKNKAIIWVQTYLSGEMQIEALRGNLFSYFQIEGLSIKLEGQPVIKVRRAFLSYDPFSFLFKKVTIRQIILEEPEVNLIQQDDKSWNLAKLIKYETKTKKTTKHNFVKILSWKFELPQIQIVAGAAEFKYTGSTERTIPKKIGDLDLGLGLWYSDNNVKLSLKNLSFESQNPHLKVKTIHTEINYNPDTLEAQNLEINTESSKLLSNLTIKKFDNPIFNVLIKGDPISMSELRQAAPELKIYGNPRLDIEARGSLNALDVRCNLRFKEGHIKVWGKLGAKTKPYVYDLQGNVSNLNLAELTNQPDLFSNLNFDFQVQGTGLEWGNMNSNFFVKFDSSYALGKPINQSAFRGEIQGNSLKFSAQLTAEGASSTFSGFFSSNTERASYQLEGNVQNLDLGRILNYGATTNLNMEFNLAGTGTDVQTMAGNLVLNMAASQVNQVYIDSAKFDLSFENQILKLKVFSISSALGKFVAQGNLSVKKENNLVFRADFTDFSVLSNSFPLDSLWGKGAFWGKIQGPLDSLVFHTNCNLKQIDIEEIKIGQLKAEGWGLFSKQKNNFKIEGEVMNASAFKLDNLSSKFQLDGENLITTFEIKLKKRRLIEAVAKGNFALASEGYKINLADLRFELFDQKWKKVNEETEVQYLGSSLSVSELVLESDDQFITIGGHLDSTKTQELVFKLENIDISRYATLLNRNVVNQEVNYEGQWDFETTLGGTLQKPVLQGSFEVEQGRYYQVDFERFAGSFNYAENKFAWKCLFSKTKSDSLLESSGFIPIKLSLSPFEQQLFYEEPVEFKVSTRGLDLSFLQVLTKNVSNIGGTLVCDIVVRNTINDLRGVGPIRLINSKFDIDELGTKYRNVNVVVVLKDKELIIKDFRMRSGPGNLEVVSGSLSLSKKYLENFSAQLKAKNFQLMNNKKMQATANGKINLSGSIQTPQFSGELTIIQARIYYPAWLEEDTAVRLTETPFFIISTDTIEIDTTGAVRFQKSLTDDELELSETKLYKNLRGELAIYFPRNTWIRSEEANIEIEGELVLVKEGPEFVLYGSFSAIRGYYELLGNRFQVKEGELVFNGEPEPNPEVHIKAVYEFRDLQGGDTKNHEISVLITGTQQYPQFRFTLDGQEADQKDILSYLLFGRNFDELTFGQRNSFAENSGLETQAKGFLAGQALNRLTQIVGKELNLDILQFERGKDWSDSKVRVGKYVTPDVFVSVSQDIGAEGDQKVELEYEIPKKLLFFNLFLQASKERKGDTGLDVIWKFEW